MLAPSKKLFHACEAVLFIAYHAKAGAIAGRDVAAHFGLAPRHLEPMLQRLARAGILKSLRGAQGGYVLARERRKVTLAEIEAALAEPNTAPLAATALGERVLQPLLAAQSAQLRTTLATLDLATLCAEAERCCVAPLITPTEDFVI